MPVFISYAGWDGVAYYVCYAEASIVGGLLDMTIGGL